MTLIKLILRLVVTATCMLPLQSTAKLFKIPGAEVKIEDKARHGWSCEREHWKTKSSIKAWIKGDKKAIALPAKRLISTTFTLPEKTGFLTPYHEANKDKKIGHTLFVGVELPSDLPAQGGLALVSKSKERLAISSFNRSGKSLSEVAWIALPHEKAEQYYGKEIDLFIKAGPRGSVVFGKIHTMLIPEVIATYMVNKPNGRNGPDILQVGSLGLSGLTIDNYAPLPVVSVKEGGPAAAAGLKKGDVILGINGYDFTENTCSPGNKWLRIGHEPVIARQIFKQLLAGKNSFQLEVISSKSGEQRTLTLTTKTGDGYAGFPLRGEASERFREDLIKTILKEQNGDGSWNTSRPAIATSFAMMGLLGTRDVSHAPAIHKAADWLLKQSPETMVHKGYWDASYIGMAVAEYALATGDLRAIQWIDRTLNPVNQGSHLSRWQTPVLGHNPNSLPYGNKSLLAPLVHMLLFDALANRAGIDHGLWDYYWPYVQSCWSNPEHKNGHGSMGYNQSYKDKGEFWSRTGLTMIITQLRNDKMHVHKANRDFMRTRHGWMRNSHAYGAPGNIWGMIALGLTGEGYANHMMKAWAPIIASQWEPGYGMRFTQPHMGAPYMDGDAIYSYPMATFLSLKNKGLHITGATDKGWLPQNPKGKLPYLRFTYSKDGSPHLQPLIGNSLKVHFTLDGSIPNNSSPIWDNNLTFPKGSIITARYIAKDGRASQMSRISTQPSERFTVISANGWPDPKIAIQRASYAFDYDGSTIWQSNYGEGATEGPWVVTLSRNNTENPMRGLNIPISSGYRGVKEVVVEGSTDNKSWTQLFTGEVTKPGNVIFNELSKHRYLKLTVKSLQEAPKGLILSDVTPLDLRPQLAFVAPGKVKVKATHKQFSSIHYTTDGQIPTQKSPQVKGELLNIPEGGLLVAKAFDKKGQSSPTSHIVIPGLPKTSKVKVSDVNGNGSLLNKSLTDGNLDSYWHGSPGTNHPHTVILEFKKPININGIWQLPRTSGAKNGRITRFKVSVSDNNRNWTDIHEGTWNYRGDRPVETFFDKTGTGKFIKLTSLAGHNNYANISELGFYNLDQKKWATNAYKKLGIGSPQEAK